MLPPDGKSDRFLATKDLKLVGQRHGKFVFCYVRSRKTTEVSRRTSSTSRSKASQGMPSSANTLRNQLQKVQRCGTGFEASYCGFKGEPAEVIMDDFIIQLAKRAPQVKMP